jgi:hypothetical protein
MLPIASEVPQNHAGFQSFSGATGAWCERKVNGMRKSYPGERPGRGGRVMFGRESGTENREQKTENRE